jgi:N-acetylneuraminic acid mutarotase
MRRLAATWARLALRNAPSARSSHGISAIGGKAFVFGGEETARHAIDSAVHCLDVHASEWTTLHASGVSPPARVGHAQVCRPAQRASLRREHQSISHAGSVRVGSQCAVGGALCVFGGRVGVDAGEGLLNDVWLFDPETKAWTELEAADGSSPPSPRSYHAATAVGETMYVFGGAGGEGRLADLHAFDMRTRRWSALPAPADLSGRGGATLEALVDGRGAVCARTETQPAGPTAALHSDQSV